MNLEIKGLVTLIQVFDMPASVAFYRDLLGFQILMTSQPRVGDQFDWGLLQRGDMQLMLNTFLRARGVDVKEPVVRDYGMRQMAFTDPDGYALCFQCPAR